MPMNTPRDAIIADLTRPPGTASPGARPGATAYRGGHAFQARRETIRFLKERVEGGRAMLAVEFEDTEGRPWQWVVGVGQQADGTWKADGGAGGSGREPERRSPWANFGGWGWPRFLCLGGRVHGEGVARVRLVDARGHLVEDQVEKRFALLLSNDAVEMPCRIELLDSAGTVLATQPWPPAHANRTG